MLFPARVCVDAVADAAGSSPEERNESTTATKSSAATPAMTAQVQRIWQPFPILDFQSLSPWGCPRASIGLAGWLEPSPSASVPTSANGFPRPADSEIERFGTVRIRTTSPEVLADVAAHFAGAGFFVRAGGSKADTIEVRRSDAPSPEQGQREVEVHMTVWRAMHPSRRIEVFDDEPSPLASIPV